MLLLRKVKDLKDLVVSTVRHAEIEQEDIGITQLIGNDSNT